MEKHGILNVTKLGWEENRMDLGLRGKTAIVTGGAKGIGSGCSEVLAQEGCNVVVVSRSDETLVKTACLIKPLPHLGRWIF